MRKGRGSGSAMPLVILDAAGLRIGGLGRRPVSLALGIGSSGGDIDISWQCWWTTYWACCVGGLRSVTHVYLSV